MRGPAAVLQVEDAFIALDDSRVSTLGGVERVVPRAWHIWKRAFDLVAGAILLVALSPLLLVLALAVRLSSPGPVLFSQMRVGRNGRLFRMFKFRTMIDGAHLLHDRVAHLNECDGPALKIACDPRLHALGRFFRRASLDELPQLWNVVCGEMSLVGPRPALPKEVERYERGFFERQAVLPGITGLWQVSGRANVPFRRWMAMDRWYVRHWSPIIDFWILARTLPAVLRRDGAW
ncbi:MAG TPA: sugar transferase [Candidatus Eremiobacteraceae bacterium]|nr:sugar transferase [Candidatus Eremiobacteraceae bacterium]